MKNKNNSSKKEIITEEMTPSTIGLVQAVGIVAYCALISGFFWLMEEISVKPPQILASTLILLLLVFSAAVCGLIVFGYPAYLALNKKDFRKPVLILGYTFIFSLAIIGIILLFIML